MPHPCSKRPALPCAGRFVEDAQLVQRLQAVADGDVEGLKELLLRLECEGWLRRMAAHLPPPHSPAALRPQQQHQVQPQQPRQQRQRQRPVPGSPDDSPGLTTAEAAAAARECQAAAAAAAAAAPREPWERQAAGWMEQAQRQAQQWESAVQPYDTSWLLDCSCLQDMLPPQQAQRRQRITIHTAAAPPHAVRKGAQPPAAAQPAAAARPTGVARGQRQGEQQAQSDGEAATAVAAAARPTPSSAQRRAGMLQETRGGAAASTPPPAVRQLGSTPAAVLQALLDGLPISHPPDSPTCSPRLAPAPASGDVLLFCRRCGVELAFGLLWCSRHGGMGCVRRLAAIAADLPVPAVALSRTSGISGLPLLEHLLVLSARAADSPSPRIRWVPMLFR